MAHLGAGAGVTDAHNHLLVFIPAGGVAEAPGLLRVAWPASALCACNTVQAASMLGGGLQRGDIGCHMPPQQSRSSNCGYSDSKSIT
jgi:hypothetical protein